MTGTRPTAERDFWRERRRGNFRACLEILAAGDLDAATCGLWASRLAPFASEPELMGILQPASSRPDAEEFWHLRSRLRDLLEEARLSETLFDRQLQQFWSHRAENPGVATFPIAADGTLDRSGAVREIVVEKADSTMVHRPQPDFVDAVTHARELASGLMGSSEVLELSWRISPDVESNAQLRGGSVGAAAFVAFVSCAVGRPVPHHLAFTGSVDLRRRRLGPVDQVSLGEKCEALARERGGVTRLLGPFSDAPKSRTLELRSEADLIELLRAVFSVDPKLLFRRRDALYAASGAVEGQPSPAVEREAGPIETAADPARRARWRGAALAAAAVFATIASIGVWVARVDDRGRLEREPGTPDEQVESPTQVVRLEEREASGGEPGASGRESSAPADRTESPTEKKAEHASARTDETRRFDKPSVIGEEIRRALELAYLTERALPTPSAEIAVLVYPQRSDRGRPLLDGQTISSADDYRIVFRPEKEAYFYVFQIDSSSKLDWLFPENGISPSSSGSNPVSASQLIQLPSEHSAFHLDETIGVEHIYVVATPTPWPTLEVALARASSARPESTTRVSEPLELRTRGVAGTRPLEPRPVSSETNSALEIPFLVQGEFGVLVHERWFHHAASR